jgi:DNA-directed RNA polymerase specialized sigma24 family protein
MAYNLFDRLDAEWAERCSSAILGAVPKAWSAEPALAAFVRLPDVVAFVRGAARLDSDEVLAGLARRAPEDSLAARTLLQLFLPACKKVSGWRRGAIGHDELSSAVVAAVWEAARTYPTAGTGPRVARRVVGAVIKAAQHSLSEARELPLEGMPEQVDASDRDDARRRLAFVLDLATRSGRLAPAEARAVRAAVDGVPDDQVAEAEKCSLRTVRWRRQRGDERLRAAALDGALAC